MQVFRRRLAGHRGGPPRRIFLTTTRTVITPNCLLRSSDWRLPADSALAFPMAGSSAATSNALSGSSIQHTRRAAQYLLGSLAFALSGDDREDHHKTRSRVDLLSGGERDVVLFYAILGRQ